MGASRPIFVIGTGRSGTTLAFSLFARHPRLTWFTNYENRFPNAPGANLARRVLDVPGLAMRNWRSSAKLAVRPGEYYPIYDSIFPGFGEPYRNLRADDVTPWAAKRFRAAIEDKCEVDGLDRIILKHTGWSRIGFLNAIFPDALFVHVHRDGRAVANSLMQQPWWQGWKGPSQWRWGPLPAEDEAKWKAKNESFAVLAGLQWKLTFREIEASLADLPRERYLRVPFAALCADSVGEVRKVWEFCGLDYSEVFANHVRATEIRPSAVDRWKKDLSEAQAHDLDDVLAEDLAFQISLSR